MAGTSQRGNAAAKPSDHPAAQSVGPSDAAAAAATLERNKDVDRSSFAKGAAITTLIAGNLKSWGLDKGRLVAAGVLAKRQGELKILPLLVDAVRGPSTATVPVRGGLWGATYIASNSLGSALGGLTLAAAAVNLQDALSDEGVEGLVTTRSGRFGMLQIGQELWGLSWNVRAAAFHRDIGQGFAQAFTGASWMAAPRVRNIKMFVGFGVMGLTLANEFGLLDFLGKAGSDT